VREPNLPSDLGARKRWTTFPSAHSIAVPRADPATPSGDRMSPSPQQTTPLGNFNYGKRGILDLTHTRLYTFGSFKRLFEQCGFDIGRMAGIPAPFPKALGLGAVSRVLLAVNQGLMWLSKGLFAYQIFLTATPRPSLDGLLDASIETAGEKAEAIREQLGELLLELKQPSAALQEFETSLLSTPNRFNGLYGAARASRLAADQKRAEAYYGKLLALCRSADSVRPEVEEAKEFLARVKTKGSQVRGR
jgi:hypothetical protein